jgi:hypothetical protein
VPGFHPFNFTFGKTRSAPEIVYQMGYFCTMQYIEIAAALPSLSVYPTDEAG